MNIPVIHGPVRKNWKDVLTEDTCEGRHVSMLSKLNNLFLVHVNVWLALVFL